MHTPNDTPTAETLLRERAWLRRLAHALARDAADADDLVQDAWLAFLRRPPREAGALRAWLRRVLRHRRVDQAARAERVRRHALTTTQRNEPPAIDVVARAEARARVGRAVLALPEPYRSTVLLRYDEDLPPRTIAERTCVPVETVRTRLRRAHALLRDALSSGADRRPPAWLLLLGVPRSGPATASRTALRAAGASTTTLAVSAGVTLAAGALVVAGTVLHRSSSAWVGHEIAAASRGTPSLATPVHEAGVRVRGHLPEEPRGRAPEHARGAAAASDLASAAAAPTQNAADAPSGDEDPFGDWSLNRILERLRSMRTPGEYREHAARTGQWDFSDIQEIEPLTKSLHRRFPEFMVPEDIVLRLAVHGRTGPFSDAARRALARWDAEQLRTAADKLLTAAPGHTYRYVAPALLGYLHRRGGTVDAAFLHAFAIHADPLVRYAAAVDGWDVCPEASGDLLRLARDDEDPEVRAEATYGAAWSARASGTPTLEVAARLVERGLLDDDEQVFGATVRALQELGAQGLALADRLVNEGGLDERQREDAVAAYLRTGALDRLLRLPVTSDHLRAVVAAARNDARTGDSALATIRERLAGIERDREHIEHGSKPVDACHLHALTLDPAQDPRTRREALDGLLVDADFALGVDAARRILARTDRDADLRREILEEVVCAFGSDFPGGRDLIEDVAQNDPNRQLRRAARSHLADDDRE